MLDERRRHIEPRSMMPGRYGQSRCRLRVAQSTDAADRSAANAAAQDGRRAPPASRPRPARPASSSRPVPGSGMAGMKKVSGVEPLAEERIPCRSCTWCCLFPEKNSRGRSGTDGHEGVGFSIQVWGAIVDGEVQGACRCHRATGSGGSVDSTPARRRRATRPHRRPVLPSCHGRVIVPPNSD